MKNVSEKTIVITGATSGIGRATALSLSRSGAMIIALGRKKIELKKIEKEINSAGGQSQIFVFDITKKVARDIFFEKIRNEFGKIDWVINSAGYIGESRSEDVRLTLATNLEALIEITETAGLLLRSGGGIINISSTASLNPNGYYPVYSASKGGVNAYTLAKARGAEIELSYIVVCPGPTDTPMRQKIDSSSSLKQSPERVAEIIKKIIFSEGQYKNGDIVIIRDGKETILKK